jgi:hypothetical protein
MKLRIATLAVGIVASHTLALAQQSGLYSRDKLPVPDAATVRVGIFTFDDQGRRLSLAVQSGDKAGADLAGTVYMAPCSSVGGANVGNSISASATEVWHVSGTVLELTAEHASIQVGWQRVRRGGQDQTSPLQSATFTLKQGDRVVLEPADVPASGACRARNASLDVTFETLRNVLETSVSAAAGGVGQDKLVPPVTLKRSTAGGSTQLTFGSGEAPPGALRAELWLVRSSPGRADDTRHVTSLVGPLPNAFGFAPIAIQAPTGAMTVRVEGTVEAGTSPTGEPQFHFSATRTTSFAPATRAARDLPPSVEGSTKTTVAMPGPDEVLSFELPPLQTPNGATVPDKLSVRVRVVREPSRVRKQP